ncbi:MAG TPA: PD-(D/E)XK nuclease family protein, partial [bacterium]|nr:PD-(D/E)XK nuclease family protein [bacterium]
CLMDDVNEETGRELSGMIEKVNREWNSDYPETEMKKTILEFLGQEEVRPFFAGRAGREIKKEWECSDSEGNLFRMDRVIVDEDTVTVIDFKTGNEKGREERDLLQVKNYLRILGEIYPDKKVEGMIAHVDLKETRRVM